MRALLAPDAAAPAFDHEGLEPAAAAAIVAAAEEAGVPWTRLSRLEIPDAALALLPAAFALRHDLLPLGTRNGRMLVAAAAVPGLPVLDEASRLAAMHAEPCLVPAAELEEALARHPGLGAELRDAAAAESGDAAVRLLDLLLAAAVARGASDVHVEPGREGAAVRFRVDGLLEDGPSPPPAAGRALVNRIKVLAGLDVATSRGPQDGAFRTEAAGRPVDVRVSILPTLRGEGAVLRVLDRARGRRGLHELGLLPPEAERLDGILASPHGLVAVAGPTGSGKTTTLHAMLARLLRPEVHVVSLEDPVEIEAPGVRQVQVDEAGGVTFASGLRSILRHDPDVVLVGETRDPETAALACRAALTGHLVLTSVHASDAASVPLRLRDLGVPARLLSSVLRGVVAQRLVRRPGARGRTGVFEVMPVSPALRRLLEEDASPAAIAARAVEEGLRPLAAAVGKGGAA